VPLDDDDTTTILVDDEDIGSIIFQNPPPPGTTLVIGPPSPEAVDALAHPGSEIIDVTLIDANGQEVQPRGSVEICLDVSDLDRAEDSGCLGFFNPNSGKWVCEDVCLDIDDDGRACGSSDHFTNFAILLSGGNGSGGGPCGSSANTYIFDEGWKDGLLIGGVTVAAGLVCCIVVVVFAFVPGVNRIHGAEWRRMHTVRAAQRGVGETGITEAVTDSNVEVIA